MAKKIITLDIGAANVALAEYEIAAGKTPTLLKYGTAHLAAPIDSGDASTILSPAIMEIVREKGIRPGPVAISIAGQMVFPRFAAIPAAGGQDKFEQMIRYEIEQNVPFPIDEMVCDSQVLDDAPNGDKNVMIVAAKTDQVEAVTDAVTSSGFRPELVDVAPIALTNAVRAATGETGCIVMLDIGAKTTSLVIAEGENLYSRSIPIAGNNVTREIAQALGCSTDEAEQVKLERGYVSLGGVAEDADEITERVSKVCRSVMTRLQAEISRSINFYRSQQGGGTPVRVYLTGGTALLPQIDEFFADALRVEVVFFNPFDWIGTGPEINVEAIGADGAFIAATVGLALHQTGDAHFKINLLPNSIISARAERARIPVVAAAGVMILAALTLVMLSFKRESTAYSEASDSLGSKLSQVNKFKGDLAKKESAVDGARESADSLRALIASRGDAVSRIKAVRDSLVPGMWIERWEPTKDVARGWTVTLRGWNDTVRGDGKRMVSDIVAERLQASSLVKPGSVSASGGDSLAEKAYLEINVKFELK